MGGKKSLNWSKFKKSQSSQNNVKGKSKLKYQCLLILLFFMAVPAAYGSSMARGWVQATAIAYITAVAMPDPLTLCASWGIQAAPPQRQARSSTHCRNSLLILLTKIF